jgi:glycosyl hydrolase family 64 (putative beta-1,3-glucanase)
MRLRASRSPLLALALLAACSSGNAGQNGDASAPADFWDASAIPPAKNVMIFKFLNRTNGKYQDSEVYWSFKSGSISETHSIAEQPTYDMPANASGRMYFYLCAADDTTCAGDPTKSQYYDFIEHTIGPTQYNGNTTRVDAFGLKIAMRLHCADGYDRAVGEDQPTFLEDRAATFQAFVDEAPAEFKPLAQAPFAPYRIVQPGAGGFDAGGANATYYDSFVDTVWANNGITIAKPGPNGAGLAMYPDLSAAIYRHVGDKAGSFDMGGMLLDKTLWADSSTFYQAAPADYYARFWHERALDGKAYGFPYDDVGGYSSYLSHASPQYMLVAVGW